MKTLLVTFIATCIFPCWLQAGRDREHHTSNPSSVWNERPNSEEELPAMLLGIENGVASSDVLQDSFLQKNTADKLPAIHDENGHQKARPSRRKKPNSLHWAPAGTLILIVSGSVFVLGLLFFVLGIGAFSYGLLLIGEVFMLLGFIGAVVGLVIGLVDM